MHWFKGAASATEDFGSGRAGLLVDWLMLQSSREFVGFLFPYHTNCRTKNVFFHVFFCCVSMEIGWIWGHEQIWCKGWGFSDTTYGYCCMGSWNASIHQIPSSPCCIAPNKGFGSSCKLDQIGWNLTNCFMHVFFLANMGHGGMSSLFFHHLSSDQSAQLKNHYWLVWNLISRRKLSTWTIAIWKIHTPIIPLQSLISCRINLAPSAPRPFWECMLSRVSRVQIPPENVFWSTRVDSKSGSTKDGSSLNDMTFGLHCFVTWVL